MITLSDLDLFLRAFTKPITEASLLGVVLAGIIMAILYTRYVDVIIYNGIVFNIAFFVTMFAARNFVDGVSAGGYIGLLVLFSIYMVAAYVTRRLLLKIRKEGS